MKEKENQVVPCIGNSEDLEVDIVDCSSSIDVRRMEETKNDETDESMSSFSGTSDTKNDLNNSGVGDGEVESIMFPDDSAFSLFGSYRSRRKGVTDHWKKFIHPLMWRCKWIELKFKELQSQALKNDSDLAEIGKGLHESFTGEGLEGKLRPFSCSVPRNRVMKRKKRKRCEEMTDAEPFMLQHHLLSYREMKKKPKNGDDPPVLDRTVKVHDNGSAFWYGWESADSKRFDSLHEEILTKIEALHPRVGTLRSRIDSLISENPWKLSYDLLASSGNEDGQAKQSQPSLIYEHHLRDLMPANAAASPGYGEVVPLPDVSDGMDWPFDEDSPFELDQYFATNNQPGSDEMMHDLEEEEKPQSPTTTITPSNPQSQAWVPLLKRNCPGKSIPKSRFRVTSMKRKRGKRKPGVNGWKSKIIMKKK